MCIRDSLFTPKPKGGQNTMPTKAELYAPVSYTHLEVLDTDVEDIEADETEETEK